MAVGLFDRAKWLAMHMENRNTPIPKQGKNHQQNILRVFLSNTYIYLQGEALLLTRLLSAGLILVGLGIFFASMPVRYVQLLSIAQKNQDSLQLLGLSHAVFANVITIADVLNILGCSSIAVIVFWRVSREWIAMFVALVLVIYGIWVTRPVDALVMASPALHVAMDYFRAFGQIFTLLFGYLFPSGRFVPRWTRWLAVLWIVATLIWLWFPAAPLNMIHTPLQLPLPVFLLFLAWLGTGLFSQIYRYAYVSTPIQRQQTKWVMFGATASLLGYIAFFLPGLLFQPFYEPGTVRVLYILIGVPVYYAFALLLPLSIGFSIMRYRLWDIDFLINRTLVYSLLTGLLFLVYFGLVISLQLLLSGVTAGSTVAEVGSTLVTAALFQPLRHALQSLIDRRFYRQKYNATRALAAFSTTLRQEIDLEQLRERLVVVVEETMLPDHVSLWLRRPHNKNKTISDLHDKL
jgi:hypothetical protein